MQALYEPAIESETPAENSDKGERSIKSYQAAPANLHEFLHYLRASIA